MKRKKGFTIVELLAVIVVLAIVLGLAVTAYIGLGDKVDVTYYKNLEESLVISGTDYFYYNKEKAPNIFGEQTQVPLSFLKENKYIEDDVLNSDGKECNLNDSYVGAYKNSLDETKYYVCLKCGDYETDTCSQKMDYTLSVRGQVEGTNDSYSLDGKKWSSKNIVLTFETANDIKQVHVTGNNYSKTCDMSQNGRVKTCKVTVDASGTYNYYGSGTDNKTETKNLKVLIDKTPPTFDIEKIGTNNKNDVETTTLKSTINNTIKNILDNESGIKTIEYSLEKDGEKDYYYKVDNATSFNISKELDIGKYNLKVRVYNNANLVTSKATEYDIYKRTIELTSGLCNQLKYTGESQKLANEQEGFTFSDNTGIDARDDYQVKAALKYGYRWNDGTVGNKTIVCSIGKKNVDVSWTGGTVFTYNGTEQGPTAPDISGVTGETLNITNDKKINVGKYTSTAILNSVTGGQNKNENYNLLNTNKDYEIIKATPTLTLSSESGSVNVGSTITFTGSVSPNISGTYKASSNNTGVATVSVSGNTISVKGVGSGNATITVDFTPSDTINYTIPTNKTYSIEVKGVEYAVIYELMAHDGKSYEPVASYPPEYLEDETTKAVGNVGTPLSSLITLPTYRNQSPPDISQYKLEVGKDNIFRIKYNRTCFGTTCDYCDKGSELGQCLYDNREKLNLWESGLKVDNEKETVRYIGKSADTNNYICLVTSSLDKCYTRNYSGYGVTENDKITFNGSSQAKVFSATKNLKIRSLSIRVKFDHITGTQEFFGNWQSAGIGLDLISRKINLKVFNTKKNGYENLASPADYIQPNVWYTITGVYDGSMMKLFINGELVNSKTITITEKASPAPFAIGGNPKKDGTISGNYAKITVQAAVAYKDALTDDEVKQYFSEEIDDYPEDNVFIFITKENLHEKYLDKWSTNSNLHRIIGVFETTHQTRVIRNRTESSTYWADEEHPSDIRYNKSNLKTEVNKKVSSYYNNLIYGNSTTKYSKILAKLGFCGTSFTSGNSSTAEKYLNTESTKSTSCYDHTQSTNRYVGDSYLSPTWISDLLLSTGNTGRSTVDQNSWMSAGEEWSFLFRNSANAWYVESGSGKLCNNNTKFTKNCNDNTSGYLSPNRQKAFRVTSQLKEDVLFCGGDGSRERPYLIGYESCGV